MTHFNSLIDEIIKVRLRLRFQKVRIKISDFKMCDLKKWILKMQLSV
jgi:hypothetical protein